MERKTFTAIGMGLHPGLVRMSKNGGLPNFFLIGAAKSGTTALYDLLAQHPQVYLPYVKEPTFFNNDNNFKRGINWYVKTYFKNAGNFPARGEATPHYLYWGEKVASRIQQVCNPSEVKFIAIFRDPVKRAYSQYWMDVQREVEWLPFTDALTAEDRRLIEMRLELESAGLLKYGYYRGGCYATLLQPYLKRFHRDQFHFLLQEDLQENFDSAMESLMEFLGLKSVYEFKPVTSNPAYVPRSHSLQHFILYRSEMIKKPIKGLFRLLPESFRHSLRKRMIQANRRPQSYPPMDVNEEHLLRGRYHDEIQKLEEILHRDLGQWQQEAT